MKRLYIALLIFLPFLTHSISLNAQNIKKQISDSLSACVVRNANVSRKTTVGISKIQQQNNQVSVWTKGSTLSYISITPEIADNLRKTISKIVFGNTNGNVRIFCDNYEIDELISSMHKEKDKQPEHITRAQGTPLLTRTDIPFATQGGLQGKHIAIYGSHGIYYKQDDEQWQWQRAKVLTTVEDLYTTSYVMPFLAPMLENAGAVVIEPRERDTQLEEIIVDDTEAISDWQLTPDGGWGRKTGPLQGFENPFKMGGYAIHKDKSQDSITYIPSIKKEGEYAIYVSYKTLSNSTKKALYTVVHKGERTCFSVNQQMGGGTWIYLGTFAFGTNHRENYVVVSAGKEDNKITTSDAVKWGGGMGSIERYAQEGDSTEACTSGYPRWIEGARYWMQYAGLPDSVYSPSQGKNDYTDDYSSRGRWVNYLAGGSAMNPQDKGLGIPIDLFFAFHTDAGTTQNDTIIGTLTIYTDYDNNKNYTYPNGVSRLRNRDLCDYVQTQLVEDIRKTYAPEWHRRELKNSSYAEARMPKMPAMLLEFLSHQNLADMKYGLDPRFRFIASRAIYKGILKFMHEQYGTEAIVQPLPVESFGIKLDSTSAVLTWKEQKDTLEPTAKPSYYIVYTRKDNGDWDNGIKVITPEYKVELVKGVAYDFKIAAGNKGGISMPSEVLSAGIAKESKGKVLIVNGFTRVCGPETFEMGGYAGFMPGSYGVPYGKDLHFIGEQYEFERAKPWVSDDDAGMGSSYCDLAKDIMTGNTSDYPCVHGRCLLNAGFTYTSTSMAALETPDSTFLILDVILGKQKTTQWGAVKKQTAYKVMPLQLRKTLEEYAHNGGRILLSGAYIGSDMTSKEEKEWTARVLHYEYRTSNATKSGGYTLLKPIGKTQGNVATTPNSERLCAEKNDGLTPKNDAKIVARYTDTNVAAAISYDPKTTQMLQVIEAGKRKTTEQEKQPQQLKKAGEFELELPPVLSGKQVIFGFPLESTDNFSELYSKVIEWLAK